MAWYRATPLNRTPGPTMIAPCSNSNRHPGPISAANSRPPLYRSRQSTEPRDRYPRTYGGGSYRTCCREEDSAATQEADFTTNEADGMNAETAHRYVDIGCAGVVCTKLTRIASMECDEVVGPRRLTYQRQGESDEEKGLTAAMINR